jgi:hypothetical protein
MQELPDFEKMDLFYLGRELDARSKKTSAIPLLYKSKNFTTHAVILGMTGSGKTGLGIALLEEAALDRIPAIIIDPKGDMANLLLAFPDLAPRDFEPWMDEDKASQKGVDISELAGETAGAWRKGLASWGEDGARIRRMREHAEFSIYTPGSSAGRPVSVLDSLQAPAPEVAADDEVLAEMVNSAVSSLLVLVGIKADPLKSRQHILLSSILLASWRKGENLDMESLIGSVVKPPFDRVGVFPLESFYPQSERMELAMQLNNIIASPSFAAWSKGVPLDIDSFLYTKDGKPRHSIFSIAHLGDEERMFFVTLLLGRLLGWMRRQQGSSTLRCLFYMDEIFGYFPPSANPPAKKAMMLLLKQARAFGLGIVLSTQNPVDLDYKGLSNIGTWFIGRLHTRQDQDRVLAGISGGPGALNKSELREMMTEMRGRTFLLSSTHRPESVLFETRWVLSYLKGPVSLRDIGRLVHETTEEKETFRDIAPAAGSEQVGDNLPLLPASFEQIFVPTPVPMGKVRYRPALIGSAQVRFFNQRRNIDQEEDICLRLPADSSITSFDWERSAKCLVHPEDCLQKAQAGAGFFPVSPALAEQKGITVLKKQFADFLYHDRKLELLRVASLKLESKPGESEEQFHQRRADLLQEKKEAETRKIEERFDKKQQQLQVRLEKALSRLDKERGDVKARGVDTALSFGVAVFGALFGRKSLSVTNATRSARGVRNVGRFMKEKGDVKRAQQEVVRIEEELQSLAIEFQDTLGAIADRFDPTHFPVETFAITPRRNDIFSLAIFLAWEPDFDIPRG